jgi:branched-chain amino acid aminotransferase
MAMSETDGVRTQTFAWVNGRPVDPSVPALSVTDRGFTLADGVFETMRATRGVIIQLDAHLVRLTMGLARLRIPLPPHLDETVSDAIRVLREQHADAAVRLTVSRGPGTGLAPMSGVEPTCVLLVYPLPAVSPDVYERGLAVHFATGRRSEHAPTAGLKTLSYTESVLALVEARVHGAADTLVLDTSGHLAEGAASNIFVVANGDVRTPPLSCGILPGITRVTVIDLIRSWGKSATVQESVIVPSDLAAVDEIFLTSSLRGIAPVTSIDGGPVGRGTPGPITRRLMTAYARTIDDEVADHALDARRPALA